MSDALATRFATQNPGLHVRMSMQEQSLLRVIDKPVPIEKQTALYIGLQSRLLIRLGMIRLVAYGDITKFQTLIKNGVELVLPRIRAENDSKDRGKMHSSLLGFRSIAQLLAIGECREARSLADLFHVDLAKRQSVHVWVKSMGLQFIHLARDDRAALEAVADEAIKSRSKKLGSAKYYALLSHAIARRDAAAAAAAIPQVLIGHRLDCDPESESDFSNSAAGEALCLYGLAMVNAAAMHGFRVPLNGDVQIPEELVVVPPEAV